MIPTAEFTDFEQAREFKQEHPQWDVEYVAQIPIEMDEEFLLPTKLNTTPSCPFELYKQLGDGQEVREQYAKFESFRNAFLFKQLFPSWTVDFCVCLWMQMDEEMMATRQVRSAVGGSQPCQ